MFKAGAMDDIDIVSFHPYDLNPRGSVILYDKIKKLLAELGYTGEIWVTEVGYPTGGLYPTRVSSSRYPAYIIKTMTGLAVHGAEKTFWYKLFDEYTKDDTQSRFDSERYFGLAYPDFTPKKGGAAYELCARHLAGMEYRPDLPVRTGLPKRTETLYFCGDNGENTLLLWNNSPFPYSVHLDLNGAEQTIYDIVTGEGKALDTEAPLTLNTTPKFITWKSSDKRITDETADTKLVVIRRAK
jgi:hypothetical protein